MVFTVKEVAQRLRLSEHTVRDAVKSGSIPAVRLGRRIRISEEVVYSLEHVGHPWLTKRGPKGVEEEDD